MSGIFCVVCPFAGDRNEHFLSVKENEANKQDKSIIEALKAAAPAWIFEAWCSSGR